MPKDDFYIRKCKTLIEEKLAWGDSALWQNQDFEALSEEIFVKTKVNLSTTTLKRLWGKATYNSNPNLTTLNVLSQFVGYENWRAFTSNGFQPMETIMEENRIAPQIASRKKYLIWIGACLLIIAVGLAVWSFTKKQKTLAFGNIQFASSPVTKGLPNSVIFKYDATDSNADSVFIQQSWDTRLRRKVDKFQKEYVCTYYRPGYYRAKLILNDLIVKEHDVFIESDGWMGIVEKEPIPIYLSQKTITKNAFLHISEEEVRKQGVDLSKEIPWVCLTDVDKNKRVSADNFLMETELRNTYKKGDAVCQHTNIVLLGTDNVIVIPLTIKGCVGELNLGFADNKTKTKDVSLFGVNFDDWVTVRCEVKNAQMKIFINQQLAFEGAQDAIGGEIIGARIRFKGAGEVKYFEIRKL